MSAHTRAIGAALAVQTDRFKAALWGRAVRAVAGLPERFAIPFRGGYQERADRERFLPVKAVEWLEHAVEPVKASRIALDASDDDIREAATGCARFVRGMLARAGNADAFAVYFRAVEYCEGWRVVPPKMGPGALERLSDAQWWRLQLRKAHARDLEGAAIDIGLVHRDANVYASDETCARRAAQVARNRAALEATVAVNEQGEEFNLAELSDLGTANKEIRRGELMTRMRGFEEIAKGCGHACEFVTLTAPSRMHKYRTRRTKDGRVARSCVPNPKYDGTKPNEAQAWHCENWARARSAMARIGVRVYGFRVVEPNHDATPHWHQILFFEVPPSWRVGELRYVLRAILRHYWLEDSPGEFGAKKHRVQFKAINLQTGSAAGYIAKYIAKNIDGYAVGKDLLGNDAITASARIEAWATTWRIRQFQQIGGAPVGVWREIRRIKDQPDAANCENLSRAWLAVQGRREGARADWAGYVNAQGGPLVARKDRRISLAREETLGQTRYGEPARGKIVGVLSRITGFIAESARGVWEFFKGKARSALPAWTRVNNCTGHDRGRGAAPLNSGGDMGPGGRERGGYPGTVRPHAARIPRLTHRIGIAAIENET